MKMEDVDHCCGCAPSLSSWLRSRAHGFKAKCRSLFSRIGGKLRHRRHNDDDIIDVSDRDGSALITRCEECKEDVPVVLSLDSKIKMNLEAQVVEKVAEAKKSSEKKKTKTAAPKASTKMVKKSKDPNMLKRPATAFFLFMDDFRKAFKEQNPDNKNVSVEFIEQVMRLVGLPGSSTGLSTEQQKRLTIAVEPLANPSIIFIFMDEPTSGLDARPAAIVMPTLLLMKQGGRVIHGRKLGVHSQSMIDYFQERDVTTAEAKKSNHVVDPHLEEQFGGGRLLAAIFSRPGQCGRADGYILEGKELEFYMKKIQRKKGKRSAVHRIEGIPRISDGCNPATWMREVTTTAMEQRISQDLAEIYKNSNQFREVEDQIKQLSVPPSGSEALKFFSTYSQDSPSQLKLCLWKQNLVYWRSPRYNAVRLFFCTMSAVIIGTVFWNIGSKRDISQDLMLVMGALYAACLFLGVSNASSVQPVIAVERTVYHREKAAGMYSSFPYAAAQDIALHSILYGVITFFIMNFERTIEKFLLYIMFMSLTFSYFACYGVMAVVLKPNTHFAAVVSSAFYSLWNLLSGFLIPKSNIPGWWIWLYYISPVAWTLRGIITSQLGNVQDRIAGPGFDATVKEYIEKNLGYEPGMVGESAAVLVGLTLLFFTVYAVSIKVLSFPKRYWC